MEYRPGIIGKHSFRIRQAHVRDHLAVLITARSTGAAKLDIALRGIAIDPRSTGKRGVPGFITRTNSYEDLYDLVNRPLYDGDDADPTAVKLKRKWVARQVVKLENLKLLSRTSRDGHRPDLIVLRDDGSGSPLDEVGANSDYYVTIPGSVIASGALADWGAPELAFFLAALIAERRESNRRRRLQKGYPLPPIGGGDWFQPLHWFSDRPAKRKDRGDRFPFSESTLERGLKSLSEAGLVSRSAAYRNPTTKKKFRSGRRNIYSNHFNLLEQVRASDSPEDLKSQIARLREGPAA